MPRPRRAQPGRYAVWHAMLVIAFVLGQLGVAFGQQELNALLIGGLDHQEVFETLIPVCEEQLGVAVEWSSLPRDQLVIRATTLGQARSDLVDVYSTHFSTVPQFFEFLEPLQDHFGHETLGDFLPASIEPAIIAGDLYQIPRYFDARMMFYRTDIFEAAGLALPTNWDELLETAIALNRPNEGLYGFVQVGQGNAIMRHFSDFLWQAGGDFLDEEYRPTFNQSAGVEALQFLVDLVHTHQVVPPGSVGFGWIEARTIFAQGAGAMHYDYPSAPPHFDDPSRSVVVGLYGFAPIPGFRTDITTAVSHGYGINRFSSRKDLAAEFIACMTSTEQQRLEYSVRGTLPARRSAIDLVVAGAEGVERERLEALEAIVESGRSWPAIAEMAQVERVIADELERALIRAKTPQQALDDAARNVEAILSEAGYY
jgi:multiple sugar transport system substrate-binding protein